MSCVTLPRTTMAPWKPAALKFVAQVRCSCNQWAVISQLLKCASGLPMIVATYHQSMAEVVVRLLDKGSLPVLVSFFFQGRAKPQDNVRERRHRELLDLQVCEGSGGEHCAKGFLHEIKEELIVLLKWRGGGRIDH